jgi:hypothetical protein
MKRQTDISLHDRDGFAAASQPESNPVAKACKAKSV